VSSAALVAQPDVGVERLHRKHQRRRRAGHRRCELVRRQDVHTGRLRTPSHRSPSLRPMTTSTCLRSVKCQEKNPWRSWSTCLPRHQLGDRVSDRCSPVRQRTAQARRRSSSSECAGCSREVGTMHDTTTGELRRTRRALPGAASCPSAGTAYGHHRDLTAGFWSSACPGVSRRAEP